MSLLVLDLECKEIDLVEVSLGRIFLAINIARFSQLLGLDVVIVYLEIPHGGFLVEP